jgi:HEAT repeat protein
MEWQGVEIEVEVPCAGGRKHPVRLRFTGWGEYEVVHNPCEELLGEVFARMAPCTHYLSERLPGLVRRSVPLKQRVIEALGASGAPAVPALMDALAERQPALRLAACQALGDIGDPQAVPALIRMLGDSDAGVRFAACRALGAIGDPRAVPALAQRLNDPNSDVRIAACKALGDIGDPQAIPHLETLLQVRSRTLRDTARHAVERIQAHPRTTHQQ